MDMLFCLQLTITGKVHGVGFRYAAKMQADILHIKGTVKNKDDGSVLIEAEGEEEEMNHYLRWCYHGPPFARVESVTITKKPLQYFAMFSILEN